MSDVRVQLEYCEKFCGWSIHKGEHTTWIELAGGWKTDNPRPFEHLREAIAWLYNFLKDYEWMLNQNSSKT